MPSSGSADTEAGAGPVLRDSWHQRAQMGAGGECSALSRGLDRELHPRSLSTEPEGQEGGDSEATLRPAAATLTSSVSSGK